MGSRPARILVTGASKGLGRAIAELLDSLGHRTFLVARDEQALRELEDGLDHATVLVADLGELGRLESIVEHAARELGGLDGLINNAGTIHPLAPLETSNPTDLARAIEVNLTAPALLMRAALPHLVPSRGRVVNVSSGAAVKPTAGWGAYCASKAGLLHLTRVVALEAPEVGFFSLRPGVIDTGMQAAIRQGGEGMREADHARFLDLKAQGKLERPEVPAQAAIWLALEGPLERSGELIDYTDDQVAAGRSRLFPA